MFCDVFVTCRVHVHVKQGWNWHYRLLLQVGLPKCIKMLSEIVLIFPDLQGNVLGALKEL